ncbi:hypothetical protein A3L09_04990 [Thermococcus profundus]|uniref:Uncharacterized protein n=1 Tax=Thermococcus profundus TaxID=49899 RepID=A0A2Z2MG75_THEPR|nr:hypothetical protein [Thermococcus profundus]ASJ03725.1 hypothetical protein A3L09_04990 [Thermococcus profundus]
MDEDPSSSSWFSRIFKGRKEEFLLEQELSSRAYEEYRRLLLRARPEIEGNNIYVRLPDGEVELSHGKLIVKAKDRNTAEKILRNLHHYEQPPSLWPAYGLSYSLRKAGKPRIRA